VAVTSIWRIKGKIDNVVDYVKNEEKTTNPAFGHEYSQTIADNEKWLSDVITYATQSYKTERISKTDIDIHDERTEVLQRFVTGIECSPETARDEMMAVKRKFGKLGGTVAYHGYQSFAANEVTPETAHEIGVKLAQKLWGARHQVIVTTHLDKAHHLHNHFVLNTVSYVDGLKFYRSNRDYYAMQRESDALCRAYSLSVIENPKRGQSKHYAEWQAERAGKPTWRGLVQSDIDTAIRQSITERQFWDNLKKAGYAVKIGKDISVRPPGKERFVRLRRNFGEDYDIEAIRRRILAQSRPEREAIPADPPPKKARVQGNIHKAPKITGLRARYFYYLYRMGVLPRKRRRQPSPKKIYFLFREDIRHMRNMAKEIRFLAEHGIDTAEQLTAFKDGATGQIAALSENRKQVRNQSRNASAHGEEAKAPLKSEITTLSAQIGTLRREVKLCESIAIRSEDMTDKLHRAKEADALERAKALQKSNTRDVKKNEPFRRRR